MVVATLGRLPAVSLEAPLPPCDGTLLAVRNALHATGYRALDRLSFELLGGTLTLRGSLPSFFLKQMAQEAARRVVGVELIRNLVLVG